MNADVLQFLADGLFAVVVALFGFSLGRVMKLIDQLDKDVRALPDKYVSRADFNRDIDRVMDKLDQIFEKLDGKADK